MSKIDKLLSVYCFILRLTKGKEKIKMQRGTLEFMLFQSNLTNLIRLNNKETWATTSHVAMYASLWNG